MPPASARRDSVSDSDGTTIVRQDRSSTVLKEILSTHALPI
ncbi:MULTISPECIES: hypothetical protein [Burkholderia]|uniref:Uncharacterized protein n=1 Tax=Burkholderia vietnamiensis TaxID=60552 RepID=A0AAW7SV54_BURVI|nr:MULTISPECIES: hypothetical protein [Burkholderia]AFJ87954.1 hypothetical protein MYA_3596 [Burkholderia sp. KJ006]MDN7793651.1 hypothetical protein [Burkholderia vietnamiensis]